MLQFPMTMFPSMITSAIQASVAVSRILSFLTSEELNPHAVERIRDDHEVYESPVRLLTDLLIDSDRRGKSQFDTTPSSGFVNVQRGSFQWNKENTFATLDDISFSTKPQSLVAIVGQVGPAIIPVSFAFSSGGIFDCHCCHKLLHCHSFICQVGAGKSSLLSALLGEMYKTNGHVCIRGSIAYVPQQPWMMNATIQENITFKTHFDSEVKSPLVCIGVCALCGCTLVVCVRREPGVRVRA